MGTGWYQTRTVRVSANDPTRALRFGEDEIVEYVNGVRMPSTSPRATSIRSGAAARAQMAAVRQEFPAKTCVVWLEVGLLPAVRGRGG